MAKKENRVVLGLECRECKHRNYVTTKNSTVTKEKLSLNKYCRNCRKATTHEEVKKLH